MSYSLLFPELGMIGDKIMEGDKKKLAGNCSYGNSQPTISLFYPFGLLLYEAAPAERIFSFTILDAGDELVEFQTLRSALCRNAEFV